MTLRPTICWVCGADDWHPPWNAEDPWKCKGCGNLVTPEQLASTHPSLPQLRVVRDIDIPLGPKLTLIEGGA